MDTNHHTWGPSSSDAELITAVRGGDTGAFGVLYERHAGAARTVARQYVSSQASADDVVSESFTKVLAVLRDGRGPDLAFRAYLFTVVRRLAYESVNGERRTQPSDDMAEFESAFGPMASTEEPALEGFERSTVARAYSSLPERWQAVLWYSEIENLPPAQIAPILGLTANSTAALAYRAREGLRQAYLQQHLRHAPSEACERANPLLGSYVRGGLAKRETATVESHLADCGDCRGLILELDDVSHGMRAVIAPLVLGLAGLGVLGTALPTWGAGLAAGATDVTTGTASTGAAASGGGATGGSAGAAGSTSGAGAAGTGAAGAGAATAASGAAASGGIAAAIAGAPALVAAGATVLVVSAGFGVAALLGVVGGDEPRPVASVTADATDSPTGDGDDSGSADPSSDGTGSDEPSDDTSTGTTDTEGADVGAAGPDETTDPSDPTNVPAVLPGPGEGTGPVPGDATVPGDPVAGAPGDTTPGDPAPGDPIPADPGAPGPTAPTPTDPTPTVPTPPTPPTPVPPVLAADLGVDLSLPSFVARADTTLEFGVRNDAGTAVTGLSLDILVPPGLVFRPDDLGSQGVFGPRLPVTRGDGWSCSPRTGPAPSGALPGGAVVRCDVDSLAPRSSTTIALTFFAARSTTVQLTAQLLHRGVPVGDPWTFDQEVAAAPAKLVASARPVASLVAGTDGHVAVSVGNSGEVEAADVTVSLPLPDVSGLDWRTSGTRLPTAPGSTPGWACTAAAGTATCSRPALAGDATADLLLPVAVDAGAATAATLGTTTTWTTDGVPGASSSPSNLATSASGLSARTVLDGPLRTAHVAGEVGAPLTLTAPPAGTVRHAELAWFAPTAPLAAGGGAALELRTDAGPVATTPVDGAPVADPTTGGVWSSVDVTDLVAAHPGTGRWTLAPTAGSTVAPGATWSLVVVHSVPGTPHGTVTVLTGPGGVDASLALPAGGPVAVSASAASAGAPTVLRAGGLDLDPTPGAGAATYLATTLGTPVGDAPLRVMTRPAPTVRALVLHTTGAIGGTGGPVAQPQTAALAPSITLAADEEVTLDGVVTVPLVARNDGTSPLVGVTITATLPAGITGSTADGSCTTSGAVVTCPLPDLAVGATAEVDLVLSGTAPAQGTDVAVEVTAVDPVTRVGASASQTFTVSPETVDGLAQTGTWQGRTAAVHVGAPLLTCVPSAGSGPGAQCASIDSFGGSLDNNSSTMRPVDKAPAVGGETSTRWSSTAVLDVPAGSTVHRATLSWSASRPASGAFDGAEGTARLRGPGGLYTDVTSAATTVVTDRAGLVTYQTHADVTSTVKALGAGEWSVADIALPRLTGAQAGNGLHGGWTLTVVYEHPSLPQASVTLFQGSLSVLGATSGPDLWLGAPANRTMVVGAVAWDGDRGRTGDSVFVDGRALTPMTGNGTGGSPQNAFDSTATGVQGGFRNSLGVDAKTFLPVQVSGERANLCFTAGNDAYLLGMVSVTVRE
ncbi:sigma-70 family RNA polymerase sigma factor [Sanguibacter suaedae]|uniref:Sigma-70 family RNA polymerase sigma factor n=1 Tax=Sanguibacter suaedae TaxID=2795737 RepID=A0A934MC01_9MICO|nr:sigma-70 family RNA polymerase sigma factor [Sanguibacter suaedae]MBI9113414.1 sigma-70 family RNA polymerase sigma factor [Sanguibacter suaedae]